MIDRPSEIARYCEIDKNVEKEGDENLKETIHNTDNDSSITAEKCGVFQQFGQQNK
jgi:hypothetical protein